MPNQHPNLFNLTGQRFGKLLVLAFASSDKQGSRWLCLCDCGKICIPRGNSLRLGTSKSCGCARKANFNNRSHGMSRSPTYNCWQAMIQRCYNSNCKQFCDYGGRGIIVCERWLKSFENFLADMGEQPKGLTIERRDNNGNYEPTNCYWETRKKQQRNRRVTVFITAFGQTKSLAEWAEISHLKSNVISYRLNHGYSPEDAVSPTNYCNRSSHQKSFPE